jgi:hypothetical protein
MQLPLDDPTHGPNYRTQTSAASQITADAAGATPEIFRLAALATSENGAAADLVESALLISGGSGLEFSPIA